MTLVLFLTALIFFTVLTLLRRDSRYIVLGLPFFYLLTSFKTWGLEAKENFIVVPLFFLPVLLKSFKRKELRDKIDLKHLAVSSILVMSLIIYMVKAGETIRFISSVNAEKAFSTGNIENYFFLIVLLIFLSILKSFKRGNN